MTIIDSRLFNSFGLKRASAMLVCRITASSEG